MKKFYVRKTITRICAMALGVSMLLTSNSATVFAEGLKESATASEEVVAVMEENQEVVEGEIGEPEDMLLPAEEEISEEAEAEKAELIDSKLPEPVLEAESPEVPVVVGESSSS